MQIRTYIATTEIFNEPEVQQKLLQVMEEKRELFVGRYNEIKRFVDETNNRADNNLITRESVGTKFKTLFLEEIVPLAIEKSFITEEHNLLTNLVDSITSEKFEDAIYSHVMINAFSEVIRDLSPTMGNWTHVVKGSEIMLLRNKFVFGN